MHSNFGDSNLNNYTNREIIGTSHHIQAKEPMAMSTDASIVGPEK